MDRPDLNFLDERDKIVKKPKKKLKRISRIIIYLLIIFVIFAIFFVYDVISSGENLSQTFGNIGLWGQIQHLIGSNDKELKGEKDDRINVALLGMGGGTHDGPLLTDTIIIASLKPSTKEVAMISIPRDLVVQIPGYGWRKINHANAFGSVQDPPKGGELASQVISQSFGIPIHYYVRIDFAGFENIIDDLGGITITVENLLDDERYPVPGKETATTTERYEHLYIEPGRVKMNGGLALKYARSRQAKGIEGSDFARSKRQQQVLLAVKDKGLSLGTIANPIKISKLMDTLAQHLSTNLEVWEILKLFNISKKIDEDNITRRVFDDSPDSILHSVITEEGAFVLIPKSGNFSELQLITQNIFNPEAIAQLQPKQIEINNGTLITGLAYRHSEYLQSLGYQITNLKNAPTQDYKKTVIYDLIEDEEDKTAENIAELLEAEISEVVPIWVTSSTSKHISQSTDILIILGQDRKDL